MCLGRINFGEPVLPQRGDIWAGPVAENKYPRQREEHVKNLRGVKELEACPVMPGAQSTLARRKGVKRGEMSLEKPLRPT